MTRRWTCGRSDVVLLLLAATTINYIDRQTLSVLAPVLQNELHLSTQEYSYVVNSFLVMYSVMYLLMGRGVDFVGTRFGLGIAVVWWSVAEILHGSVTGFKSLCLLRGLLAIGEAAIIPSGVKAVAEWFKAKDPRSGHWGIRDGPEHWAAPRSPTGRLDNTALGMAASVCLDRDTGLDLGYSLVGVLQSAECPS